MLENFKVLCHSSIKVEGSKIIYFDPFRIKENYKDADYIFCTHSHYDHFSPEDIKKIMKENTKLIVPKDIKEEASNLVGEGNVVTVEPGKEYKIDYITFKTTYAYNETKKFHPRENEWVGYIVENDGQKYYVTGDTDNIKEIQDVVCDIAFIPVGGTYTMDFKEASELANAINAKIVVPTHYGEIVGEKEDGNKFAKLVKNKEVKVFIK